MTDIARATHTGWTERARALRSPTRPFIDGDWADHVVPFGGFKQSGPGRDESLHALEGHTQLKTTWTDLS